MKFGSAVYYTACSFLVMLMNSCCKVRCQKSIHLILFSCKIARRACPSQSRFEGLRSRVWGLALRVQCSGFGVEGLETVCVCLCVCVSECRRERGKVGGVVPAQHVSAGSDVPRGTCNTLILAMIQQRGWRVEIRTWWCRVLNEGFQLQILGYRASGAGFRVRSSWWRAHVSRSRVQKEIQTPMTQGRSTKIISMIEWIQSSRL